MVEWDSLNIYSEIQAYLHAVVKLLTILREINVPQNTVWKQYLNKEN